MLIFKNSLVSIFFIYKVYTLSQDLTSSITTNKVSLTDKKQPSVDKRD